MKVHLALSIGLVAFASVALATTLPSDYQEVEYVRAPQTGGNQWINTLYTPNCTDVITTRFSLTDLNNTQTMYCSRGNSTSTDSMTCFFVGEKFRYDRGTGGEGVAQKTGTIKPSADTVYTMVVSNNLSTGSAWLNGEKDVDLCNNKQQSFTPGSVLTIFQSHTTPVTSGGNWGTYRCIGSKSRRRPAWSCATLSLAIA